MGKRVFGLVLICLLVAAGFAFANGQQGKGASAGGTVTVVGNASFHDALQAVIDAGIYTGPARIDLQLVPENEIDPKIRLEMQSGAKTFDLAITEAGGARQYGGVGLLATLPAPADWDDFFDGNREQHSIANDIYGYPILADNGVMFYNEAMLKDGGYNAPPKTWDEFWKMAVHLTKDTSGRRADEPGFDKAHVVQYGLSFKGAPGAANPWEFTYYLYGNNLHYIEKDFVNSKYEVTVNRPEIVAILERIMELKNKYSAIPDGFVNYDYDENRALMAQGKVAIIFDWPSAYVEVFRDSPAGKDIKPSVLPTGSRNNSGPIGGWSVNVFKDSKNITEAIKVAQAFTSKEGLAIFARVQGSTPTRKSVMASLTAEWNQKDPSVGLVFQTVEKALTTGQEMDLAQTLTASKDVVMTTAETLNGIFAGQTQPKAALDGLKPKLEAILVRNNYMK